MGIYGPFDYYFTLKFRDLKIVDNIFLCAIMAANSQVAMLARYVPSAREINGLDKGAIFV
jgi:hypothetical protein